MNFKRNRLDEIKKQIEFYLSDSNIRHDKFLRNKIAEINGNNDFGIPISLITTFNEMIKLNASNQDIIESLSSSESLFINLDNQTIHRLNPINLESCSIIPQDRMLFIKRIPAKWNHRNIRKLLNTFGNVLVVRLPKINKTNIRRHYGFVEMETAQQARNAIENYKEIFPHSNIVVLPWSKWISTKNFYKIKRKRSK